MKLKLQLTQLILNAYHAITRMDRAHRPAYLVFTTAPAPLLASADVEAMRDRIRRAKAAIFRQGVTWAQMLEWDVCFDLSSTEADDILGVLGVLIRESRHNRVDVGVLVGRPKEFYALISELRVAMAADRSGMPEQIAAERKQANSTSIQLREDWMATRAAAESVRLHFDLSVRELDLILDAFSFLNDVRLLYTERPSPTLLPGETGDMLKRIQGAIDCSFAEFGGNETGTQLVDIITLRRTRGNGNGDARS